jgi:hypothetical protein
VLLTGLFSAVFVIGLALARDAWARVRLEPHNAEQLAILRGVLAQPSRLRQNREEMVQK